MRHWSIILESDSRLAGLERVWKTSGSTEDLTRYYHGLRQQQGHAAADEFLDNEIRQHVGAWMDHSKDARFHARMLGRAQEEFTHYRWLVPWERREREDAFYDRHEGGLTNSHNAAVQHKNQAVQKLTAVLGINRREALVRAAKLMRFQPDDSGEHHDAVQQIVGWHQNDPSNDKLKDHYDHGNSYDIGDGEHVYDLHHNYRVSSHDEADGIKRSLTDHKAGTVMMHNTPSESQPGQPGQPGKHNLEIWPRTEYSSDDEFGYDSHDPGAPATP